METQSVQLCQQDKCSVAISTALASRQCSSLGEVARRKDNTLIVYAAKANYQELHTHIVNNVCDIFSFFEKPKENISEDLAKAQFAKYLKLANDVAELIIEEYNDLPIECINIFFKDVKKGKFGNPYGSISGGDIMRWFGEFYQNYWQEFNLHVDEIQKQQAKETEEEPVPMPESVQRLKNQLSGKGFKTDAECEQARTADQIRKDVISKHSHLYRTMSVDDANRAIDEAIKVALMAEGIFE